MQTIEKRPLMIERGWIQAAGLVLIIGFFIMGVLTFYTYNDEPPIPEAVPKRGACGVRIQAREAVCWITTQS